MYKIYYKGFKLMSSSKADKLSGHIIQSCNIRILAKKKNSFC